MANLSNINNYFVVDTTGKVAIGDVSAATLPTLLTQLTLYDNTATASLVIQSGAASGKKYELGSSSTGKFQITDLDAGLDRLTVATNGRIGIGTSNPVALLVLSQANGANIRFENQTTSRVCTVGEGVGTNDVFSFRGNSFRSTDTLSINFMTNRVGIREISPTQPLHISGSGNYDPTSSGGQTTNGILIKGGGTTGDDTYTAGIGFAHGTGTSGISGVQNGSDGDRMGLGFFTHGSGTGSAASSLSMIIQSGGEVGIGPQSNGTLINKLQVSTGVDGDGIILTGIGDNTGIGNGSYRKIGFRYDDTDESFESEIRFVVTNNSAHGGQMEFFTDNTSGVKTRAITIDNAQRVGIGTNSPSAKLNVIDGNNTFVTSDTNSYPRLTVAGGSVQLGLFRSSSNVGGGYIGADGGTCFHVRDASFATKLYLTQGGNLGIGTTNPTSISANTFSLSVGSTRNDLSGAIIYQANGTVKSQMYWDSAGLQTVVNSGDARWYVGGVNDRLRITSTGNVGIGTSLPTTKFQVVNGFFQHSASKSHNSNVNLFSIQFSAGTGTCKGAITVNITGSRYSPGNNDYAGGAVYHLTRNNVGNLVTATQYTFGTWQPAIDTNNSTKTWTFSSAHFGLPGNLTSYSVTIQGAGHQTTAVINPVVTIL